MRQHLGNCGNWVMPTWGFIVHSSFEYLKNFIINLVFKLDNSSCHCNINNGLTQIVFADLPNLPVPWHPLFLACCPLPRPESRLCDSLPTTSGKFCSARKFRASLSRFLLVTWTGWEPLWIYTLPEILKVKRNYLRPPK